MDREALEQLLTAYTAAEQEYLREGTPDKEVPQPSELLEEEILPPGESIGIVRQDRFRPVGSHKHNYIELNYVWSGGCSQVVQGKKIVTSQGEICLMDSEAEHSVGLCDEQDILINILIPKRYFNHNFFSRMSGQGILSRFLLNAVTKQRNREHFLQFPTSQNPKVAWIMEQILLEYYGDDLGRQEVLDSYMILLFTEMLRCFRADSGNECLKETVPLFEILHYMEKKNLTCTLSQTAEYFGFHPVYLTAMLKEKTGKSFVEHIQSQRISQAGNLLLRTDLTVAEIAEKVGYNNVEFFYRKFRQMYECTPGEYRKNFSSGS